MLETHSMSHLHIVSTVSAKLLTEGIDKSGHLKLRTVNLVKQGGHQAEVDLMP